MDFFVRLNSNKPLLLIVAAFGFFGLNSVFVYYALTQPEMMTAAMQNPISLVFILEAFLMMGFGAWLITKLELRTPGWLVFIGMTMIGSLAFSLPAFLWLHARQKDDIKQAASRT